MIRERCLTCGGSLIAEGELDDFGRKVPKRVYCLACSRDHHGAVTVTEYRKCLKGLHLLDPANTVRVNGQDACAQCETDTVKRRGYTRNTKRGAGIRLSRGNSDK